MRKDKRIRKLMQENYELKKCIHALQVQNAVTTRNDKWICVWEDKELRKLHTWLKENFPLWKLLRTGGDFKNVSDLQHYEIKRKI